MGDYTQARLNMVESQLRVNKVIDDKVVEAFSTIPRESFVPKAKRGFAYLDEDIAIGGGRYLLEPMVLARLVEEAFITSDDIVLSVAGGTGYATAIMAKLASFVVGLEEVESLTQKAVEILDRLEITNTLCVTAPIAEGYAKQAPYQVILINGEVDMIPEQLLAQLDENGGRLLGVVEKNQECGEAVLIQRDGSAFSRRPLFDAFTPKLEAFAKKKSFVF